ncbi:helix-turn-helix domain-containing protein [Vallitalea maricola]|uniref:Helix-turn-helix transcriptional regulator n=1 Tax=Vallitalea maricola TaxID=3074433 RepID=A0ACB5UPN9_9FIRM|nr:helix-turn-helix transcriptional regulator [Vallitalea sp. AN17-2]
MYTTIGNKIKQVRKELHITQTQLAGQDMTKSMISQIENGMATPSMKNLIKIADRLNKPVSFFLEENIDNNTLPIKKIQAKMNEITILIDNLEYNEAVEELKDLLSTYNFYNHGKLHGDILFKLGECLGELNLFDESEKHLDKAIKIYDENQLYSDSAMAYMEKMNKYLNDFNYEACLSILKNAMDKYNSTIIKDYLFELRFLFVEAMIYSGLGNFDYAIKKLENAVSLSAQNHIYYNSDTIYQTLACINLICKNYSSFLYNIKKAEQFSLFTEDTFRLSLIYLNYAEYEIINHNPDKALDYLNQIKDPRKDLKVFYTLEKAKVAYLLQDYDESLALFESINYKEIDVRKLHKYDYLFMWSAKIYHGLTLMKIGKLEEALKQMNIGISKFEVFRNSIYHIFAYKSISELYNLLHDYKTAFKYLKSANDMEESLEGLPYR